MEMRNELINKLNKKDKEEMLSRIKKEKDNSYHSIGFSFVDTLFKYLVLLVILIPLYFIAFETAHPELLIAAMGFFFIIVKVLLYAVAIGFIIDYIIFFIKQIRIIRIKKEYFEVIPKRK